MSTQVLATERTKRQRRIRQQADLLTDGNFSQADLKGAIEQIVRVLDTHHAGKAASSGALAALLAARGFNSSDEILEGKRGFIRIYSTASAPERIAEGLGERFEIARNGHKPYACGVVLHPLIDAMIALHDSAGIPADQVERVELQVHPHAVKITGVDDPKSGLMSKFSINHSASVAYLDGTAGIAQYSDARAGAADVLAFRPKVHVTTVETFRKDQAHATLVATDGRRWNAPVAHASGTVDNPMSDAALERKFLGNAGDACVAQHLRVCGEQRETLVGDPAMPAELSNIAVPAIAGEAPVLDKSRRLRAAGCGGTGCCSDSPS